MTDTPAADVDFIVKHLAWARTSLEQIRQELDRHVLFLTIPPPETMAEWLRQLEIAVAEAEIAYDEANDAIIAAMLAAEENPA